jgi:O-antigen/teichoic acid export membrane protein
MNERPDVESPPDEEEGPEDSPDYTARILKGSSSVFSGSIIGKGVGFVLQLVLTRGLGPALYGIYSYGLTVLRFAREIGTLGFQNGIVRFASPRYEVGDSEKVKGVFLTTGGLGFGAGLVLGIGLFVASPGLAEWLFQDPGYTHVFQLFACGLPFYVFTYLASRMARALDNMRVDVLLSSILQPALFLLLVSGLFLLGMGFTAALYAFLISTVLAAGASLYAVFRFFPPLFSSLSADVDVRALLRFSLPIVGISLAGTGLTYADRLMLGILRTEKAVGIYQAAALTSMQLRFILYAITSTFSPIISDLYHNHQPEALSRLYADTVRWIITGTLPLAVVLITFAPEIMSVYGSGFREGVVVLRILALAYIIVAGSGSVGHMLQMSDHQDFALGVNTVTVLFNLGLNWILIQWYGVMGAALATAITQALSNVAQLGGLYWFTAIQPFRWNLWKPAAAAAGTALIIGGLYPTLSVPARWLVGLPAVPLLYVGLLFALGLPPRDRSLAEDLWKQLRASLTS